MPRENDPAPAGLPGDGEIRVGRNPIMHLHEVDTETDQRIDSRYRIVRRTHDDVWERNALAGQVAEVAGMSSA